MLHSVAKILEDSDNSFRNPTGHNSVQEIYTKQQSSVENETVLKQWDSTKHFTDRITNPRGLDELLCIINGHFDLQQQCLSSPASDNGLQKCPDKCNQKMLCNESLEWDSKLCQILLHSLRCCTGSKEYSVSYQDNLSEFVENQSPTRRTNGHFKQTSKPREQDCSACGNETST